MLLLLLDMSCLFLAAFGHLLRRGCPLGSLVCDLFLCFCHFLIRCPGSGVIRYFMDFWSLHSSLLCCSNCACVVEEGGWVGWRGCFVLVSLYITLCFLFSPSRWGNELSKYSWFRVCICVLMFILTVPWVIIVVLSSHNHLWYRNISRMPQIQ